MDWSDQEFDSIELGDKRLNKRVQRVCQMLYEQPEESINEACGGWQDTKAAYRLFDNEKVDPKKLLSSHREKTLNRMKDHKTVLAIQDTTFFNYDNHESKSDLGLIHSNKLPIKGILAHNTLITTPDGMPLGLFDQKIYARKNNKKKHSPSYAKIKTKESYRWLESIETLSQHQLDNQKCIVVADREGDIFELMQGCINKNLEFIIRSTHNRVVGEKKKRWGTEKNANEYLLDYVAKQESQAQIEIEVRDQKTKRKRVANLDMRFCEVVFPAPWRLDHSVDGPSQKNKTRAKNSRPKVNSYIVEVKELKPPKGSHRVHWRLITSMQVSSVKQAKEIIEFYKTRWTIEIYHRVLKSGCKVEDCRLKTFKRLQRYLTLQSIIAWRLLWMTRISRHTPKVSCEKLFSQEEWQALYRIANKTKRLPKTPPTIRETIRWLAQLGGFLSRTSDGEPGITVIWRGWEALNTFLNLRTYG